MVTYHIRFVKTVCDDYGHEHRCVQGDVHIRRARTEARAVTAAKLRFQRLNRTAHWTTHAEDIEIRDADRGSVLHAG